MESVSQSKYLLDTSAVFTFLEDEAGAERVETLLRQEVILLSYITLLETYYITFQEQSEDVADKRYALLKQLPTTILWEVDEVTLLTAGRFKAYHRLSLADAMIAAFAQRQGAILIHKDPEFEALIEVVEQEMLPYKIPQSDFSRTE
ncbi:MAG: type II toxin-antitoxin system VapC family toxin [Chloroflexi bacterium]|nr:type II toxin-antitoxin system VapC family toxin [Chloroflexota bacterium]